jgi:hypothetical protein
MKFKIGDRVRKIGGDYQMDGTVVAAFLTTSGAERYVFEANEPKGLLHIYSERNLDFQLTRNSEMSIRYCAATWREYRMHQLPVELKFYTSVGEALAHTQPCYDLYIFQVTQGSPLIPVAYWDETKAKWITDNE